MNLTFTPAYSPLPARCGGSYYYQTYHPPFTTTEFLSLSSLTDYKVSD